MLGTLTDERHDSADAKLGEFLDGHLKAITVIEHTECHRDPGLGQSTDLFTLDHKIWPLRAAQGLAESDEPPTVEHTYVLAVAKP